MGDSDVRKQILDRNPGLAKSLARGSRVAAVKLSCIECMGGSRSEARKCGVKDCFLWPFGLAGKKAAKEQGTDPPKLIAMSPDRRAAASAALAKYHADRKAAKERAATSTDEQDEEVPI